eukprot:CAMPEP_0201593914 /NCGR_PEP_ID=MMETSP0190_2-20130828/191395_1 /ASSEMBLY_ACC=CAM_ASM_000263 /TAXON_ID=37353 /ORGANISM="Rosalina sp." /LENGTH=125 /DNA_ID=CAMNT_0048053331 /DNA_START=1204 /DNA_END=1581 /DNA_ORIENTATION=-
MNVEFEYRPFVDSVEELMDELVRDLKLNTLRKDELVQIFRMKLIEMNNGTVVINTKDKDKLDEIEMIFDHDANHLKFKLNGKDYKEIQIGHRNYEGDGGDSYRMGITFNGYPAEIELFDYQLLKV